MDLCLTS
jgi:hypothetical protein